MIAAILDATAATAQLTANHDETIPTNPRTTSAASHQSANGICATPNALALVAVRSHRGAHEPRSISNGARAIRNASRFSPTVFRFVDSNHAAAAAKPAQSPEPSPPQTHRSERATLRLRCLWRKAPNPFRALPGAEAGRESAKSRRLAFDVRRSCRDCPKIECLFPRRKFATELKRTDGRPL